MALEAARVPEKAKLVNVVSLMKSDVDFWLYSFLKQYSLDESSSIYTDFKAAIIRKYESSEVRDDHLRSKLQSLKLEPNELRNLNEYVSRFRSLELQIHIMTFKDHFHFFAKSLSNELALYLHDQKFDNMKDIYEV